MIGVVRKPSLNPRQVPEDESPYDVLPVNADEATEPDTYDKNQY